MSTIQEFALYAAAFERAYASDDWQEIESILAEDVVYEVGLPLLGKVRCEGRAEMVAWFRRSLDTFDRRFERRALELVDGPEMRDGNVWLSGTATYEAEGVPPFVLRLEETIRFEEGQLVRLVDAYSDEMKAEAKAYIDAYGEQLGIEDQTPG